MTKLQIALDAKAVQMEKQGICNVARAIKEGRADEIIHFIRTSTGEPGLTFNHQSCLLASYEAAVAGIGFCNIPPLPEITCCDDAEPGAWCPTCGREAQAA